MAGASLLTLLDDIASILDDVSAMTKVATKKTAGVLGDDLALNAQQVSGVRADRELAVVWAVAKGSFKNKAILVPAALVISAVAPVLIMPLLMLGGAFLCYEGFEKIVHTKAPSNAAADVNAVPTSAAIETDKETDKEADKIRGAIRTDFILSAEIIVISLGTVADAPLLTQCAVLVAIALLMTVGVYGLVAGIVKLDDAGLYLSQRTGALRTLGNALLRLAPWLMKTLSVVGTAAMFLVGGGILAHGVPPVYHLIESAAQAVTAWPLGGVFSALTPTLLNALIGMAAGAVVFAAVALTQRLRRQRA